MQIKGYMDFLGESIIRLNAEAEERERGDVGSKLLVIFDTRSKKICEIMH